MTGQGQARSESADGALSIELRTVNNRHLKFTMRLGEPLAALESQIERTVRKHIRRGTVQLNASYQPAGGSNKYRLNTTILASYFRELAVLETDLQTAQPIDLGHLSSLPGVVEHVAEDGLPPDELWQQTEPVLLRALENLNAMRATEAQAMRSQLLEDHGLIVEHLHRIEKLAPRVAENYRQRLQGKVETLLQQHGVEAAVVDILREVQLFADRSDTSEEITRLSSHLEMFTEVIDQGEEAVGRKLDFVIQEMFRETNTIGSKANDAEIARSVVEIKCAIERMRELVQNLE